MLPPNERDVSMVFQSYALFPHMTVMENVAYGLADSAREARRGGTKAREGLALVGLDGFDDRLPSELSGGQQQRVAVARALVLEPQVLLFDEPLSNLDAKLRRRMREEIRDLQQSLGLTSVYVTHDQEEALAVSDKIVVMNRGAIAQEGTPGRPLRAAGRCLRRRLHRRRQSRRLRGDRRREWPGGGQARRSGVVGPGQRRRQGTGTGGDPAKRRRPGGSAVGGPVAAGRGVEGDLSRFALGIHADERRRRVVRDSAGRKPARGRGDRACRPRAGTTGPRRTRRENFIAKPVSPFGCIPKLSWPDYAFAVQNADG